MKRVGMFLTAIALAICPVFLSAQQSAPNSNAAPVEHHFKLNLVVEQTNDAGKVVNTRSFVTTVATTDRWTQSIRTGEKVPVATGGGDQWTYLDIGVDFDMNNPKTTGNDLSFRLAANVSSIADSAQPADGAVSNRPVVRQDKWDAVVVVPIGKPTVVFSADDLRDKGKMQVEVTATRID